MRILLVSSTYRPVVGGVETVTDRLARQLAAAGHEVSVVTNRYPRSLEAGETLDGIPVVRRLFPNLVPSPGRRSTVTLAKQLLSIPLAVYQLAFLVRLMRKERPDIVNVHYLSYPAAYGLVAARIRGVPVVLSFHGSDVPGSPYPATYRWVARIACHMSRLVTCGSEDLGRYLRAALARSDAEKIRVCHFGIDDWAGGDAVPPDARNPTILVAARLVEKKGVDVAIRAVGLLKESERWPPDELRLLIAGAGPLERDLHRLAVTLGLEKEVEFAGSLDPAELHAAMVNSLFVVVPSKWEAFGVVALEAMIGQRCVVGTTGGGLEETVVDGETGILVPPGDAAVLAGAMERLISNPAGAAAMGLNGRERALSRFSWSDVAARFEEFYRVAVWQ